jgi:hypothetical protein
LTKDALKVKSEFALEVDGASDGADMSHVSGTDSDLLELDDPERRSSPDRRKRTVYSLFYGSFNPRRRTPRRLDARSLRDLDWHHPKWLVVATLIIILSCVDALLTLTLLSRGAYEVNPFMAPIVDGSPLVFTLIKVALTSGGVVMLTLAARMRVFGRIPVGSLLLLVLIGYGTLVVYEWGLLEETSLTF